MKGNRALHRGGLRDGRPVPYDNACGRKFPPSALRAATSLGEGGCKRGEE